MPDTLRLALAQLNPTVGDVAGNLAKARAARAQAAAQGADILVLTELFLAGYPPEDLVLRPAFQDACRQACEALAADTADGGPAVLIGLPWAEEGRARPVAGGGVDGEGGAGRPRMGAHDEPGLAGGEGGNAAPGRRLYNAYAALDGGRIVDVRFKVDLPNYGVFDEKRLFDAGPMPGPVMLRGVRLGLPICEDIWTGDVTECLAETGAEILIVPNGSPFWRGKHDERLSRVVARVKETDLPLVYVNMLGGQDELVFDGASFALNADLSLTLQLPACEEAIVVSEWRNEGDGWRSEPAGPFATIPTEEEMVWRACVLGTRDYVEKNRFPGVVIGLSGGIDSALVAMIAVDALGPERVHTVMLPYRYTSSASIEDAAALAGALGCRHDVVPIAAAVEGLGAAVAPLFAGRPADATEENLQSRARGTILMAISNKLGGIVLTTGNKSEMSVGYATLYGDMNGGFNPLKDLFKQEVFRLARWRNAHHPDGMLGPAGAPIPARIIDRAPSAELREDQRDEDSLPPYAVLDAVLAMLVEEERSVADVAAAGFDPAVVARVARLVASAEHKRRQAPPGVKITRRNFGRDRRYPITNRFREE